MYVVIPPVKLAEKYLKSYTEQMQTEGLDTQEDIRAEWKHVWNTTEQTRHDCGDRKGS